MRLFVVLCVMLLAGCASQAPKTEYTEYLQVMKEKHAAQEARIAGIAAAAASCQDARCTETVAAFAAMAAIAGNGGQSQVQAPPRQLSGTEKFAQVVGALSPLVGTLAQSAVSWHQADTSARVSEAQYQYLGSVVGNVTAGMRDVTTNMANVAANAQPNVTVGGDYTVGNGNQIVRGQVGDSAGRDFISGTVVNGNIAGRDQIGRDQVQNSHIGDNDRFSSPGPYEGPFCTGDGCQPQPAGDDP